MDLYSSNIPWRHGLSCKAIEQSKLINVTHFGKFRIFLEHLKDNTHVVELYVWYDFKGYKISQALTGI